MMGKTVPPSRQKSSAVAPAAKPVENMRQAFAANGGIGAMAAGLSAHAKGVAGLAAPVWPQPANLRQRASAIRAAPLSRFDCSRPPAGGLIVRLPIVK